MAAQQRAHTLAAGLADQVPHRAIHAGDRFHERLPVAARMAELEQSLPDSLGLEDAHAAHARCQLLVDQPHDGRPVLAVVTVVDLADQTALGAHPRDPGAALEDRVRAAAEIPAERNVDRDGLDAMDAHDGRDLLTRWSSHVPGRFGAGARLAA